MINEKNPNNNFLKENYNTKLADSWHLFVDEIIKYFKKARTKGSDEFFMKSKNADAHKYAVLQNDPGMIRQKIEF